MRPFQQSRVEAVWSTLGDVGQSWRMSVAVDAQDDDDDPVTGECPLYSNLLLDLSREEDESSAKDDQATNNYDD